MELSTERRNNVLPAGTGVIRWRCDMGEIDVRLLFDYSAERPPGLGDRAYLMTPAEAGQPKRFAAVPLLHPGPAGGYRPQP